MTAKKRKKNKKNNRKTGKVILSVLLIFILLVSALIVINPSIISSLLSKIGFSGFGGSDNSSASGSLRGSVTEKVIWPDGIQFAIEPGESFTFDVLIEYSDNYGNVETGYIQDPLDLTMRFSDSSYCDKTSYNTIVIKDNVPNEAEFMVTLIYKNSEQISYGFVVYVNQDDGTDDTQADNPED